MVANRRRACGISQTKDRTGHHSPHVGVDDGNPLAVGETGDRPRGVGADSGQAQQCLDVVGYHVGVLGRDRDSAFVQPFGASGIAEFAPGPQNIPGSGGRGRRRRGPPRNPVHPDRRYPRHRSLLEHELTDQDLPRTHPGGAPRKVPPGSAEPVDKIRRRDAHQWPRREAVHNTGHGEHQSCASVDGTEEG